MENIKSSVMKGPSTQTSAVVGVAPPITTHTFSFGSSHGFSQNHQVYGAEALGFGAGPPNRPAASSAEFERLIAKALGR